MPELLTLELLERLDYTLRGLGAAVVDQWEPGMTREQMDLLTKPHGFVLPDEAALWWGWHNGAGAAEIIPTRQLVTLEGAVEILAVGGRDMEDAFGLTHMLIALNEQPWLWFDCRGAPDAPVPVYAGSKANQPRVAAESIGEMVLIMIAALEAGAFSTDECGEWNEPNWEIVEADTTGIL
jgi:hypothetical protein